MNRQRRRALGYLALIIGVLVGFTLAYYWGMRVLEGEPRTLLHSLEVVVQTFTTVGYGEDAGWQSPGMLALVIVMQFAGIFLVFLALPLFVVPWLERRLEIDAPREVDLADHVVVCGYTTRGEMLVEELEPQDVSYVVVERDRDRARDLHKDGVTVVYGDPSSTEALERAGVGDARAVILDEDDETNATVALAVREVNDEVRLIGFVEDPAVEDYLGYAGADRVLCPRVILGESLADKVTSAVTTQLGETIEVGEDFEIVEMPIQLDSELDGVTLAESRVRERTGANVIGAWFGGEFAPNPDPDRVMDRGTVLLVSGSEDQLEALKRLTLSEERRHRRDRVLVVGYGEVGSTVEGILTAAGIATTVVDREEQPGVDVVGDATDAATLREAGIDEASAVILALGDDSTTVFTTLVARELDDEVEIVSRANEPDSAPRLYSAGADYVLVLATVSGRMLVSAVLDEEVMSLETQVEVVRAEAPGFVGETLAEADIRYRTGCTVIAVEREGRVLTDVGPDFHIEAGDALVVAGTDEDMLRFNDLGDVRVGGG